MGKIEWYYPVGTEKTKATASDIKRVENYFNLSLPKSLKQIVLKNNAAYPYPACFDFGKSSSVLGPLLSFSPNDEDTVINCYERQEGFPEFCFSGLVPIASDPSGNLLCLQYKEPSQDEPNVVFWDHEESKLKNAITLVANSFEEFLESLYE